MGGGVLLAGYRKFRATLLQNFSLTESIFLKVETRGAKYLLAVVYLPPDSSTFDYMRFLSALESVTSQHPHYTLLLGGDFNLPNVIWGSDPLNFKFSVYTPPNIRGAPLQYVKPSASLTRSSFILLTQLRDIRWNSCLHLQTAEWIWSVLIYS